MSADYYSPHPRVRLECPVALTGLPGSDVAAAGRSVAGSTGLHFVELERLVESMQGASRAAIATQEGGEALRAADDLALRRALRDRPAGILAIESAMPQGGHALDALHQLCRVVYVRRPPDELLRRIRLSRERAPARLPEFLLGVPDTAESLSELLATREPAHRRAHVVLEAADLHPHRVARELIDSLELLA